MQRFRLSLVLAAALASSSAAAQNGAAADPGFKATFGAVGEVGSFRFQFSDLGAGIQWMQMLDHVRDGAELEGASNDDYLLLYLPGMDFAFRVNETTKERLFAPALDSAAWRRELRDDGSVHFAIESGSGLVLHKTFRARPGMRGFALELRLENQGDQADANKTFEFRLGGPALVNPAQASFFGNSAVAIAVLADGTRKWLPPAAGPLRELLTADGRELSMAGSTNRYFGSFLFPLDDGGKQAVQRIEVQSLPPAADLDSGTPAFAATRALLSMRLTVPAVGASATATFGVYAGPKSFAVFAEHPEHGRLQPILDVDLDSPCCGVTVPGGKWLAGLLVKLLNLFHGWVGGWGVAIMMLTILVRGCLAPLNFRMQKSMRAYGSKMAVLKPKMDKLKQQHSDDPKAYQQAMLQFQREHKIMPPLGGCLPIFLTMPIYIGLFTALRTAYDLRHQHYLWITDLSQPDALFPLPFFPHQFNLLPIAWISMFVTLQLRMPLPTDPQQRQMQQIMRYMPVLFGLMLYNYAAGLMVYMVTSMLWTFVESAITKKILGPLDPNAAALAPTPMM